MSDQTLPGEAGALNDVAPGQGDEGEGRLSAGLRSYLIGLALAAVLTIASFWAAQTHLIYEPGVVPALVTLCIAQMGIHLVFFLHITTAPDNTNNVLALGFGIVVVCFVVLGSIWIMAHLDHMSVPMDQLMRMPR